MRLTAEQVAEFYGVDKRTVTNWVNSNPPCPSRKNGAHRFFDSVLVAAWKEAKARETAHRDETPLDFEAARARKMSADAELAEMEVARTRGDQVSVDSFREALDTMADRVRAQLLAAPGRYSARLVGTTSLPEAQRALDAVMRDVLNDLKAS